jgi:hypothetical protein
VITRFGPREEMIRRLFPPGPLRARARKAIELMEFALRQHEVAVLGGREVPDPTPVDDELLGEIAALAILGREPNL